MDLAPGRFYVGFFLCVIVVFIIFLWSIDALRFAIKRARRRAVRKDLLRQMETSGSENLQAVVAVVE